MRPRILLTGQDLGELARISVCLPHDWAQELSESQQPVDDLMSRGELDEDAAVIFLHGRENVVDLRDLLSVHAGTRFLFLTPRFPPPAAMARVIARGQGSVLACFESPLVVAATLIAMLVQSDVTLQ